MGLHIGVPGLILKPAAVLGTVIFPTDKEQAILDLPNLRNWFRASDAQADADGLVWTDRVTGIAVSNTAALSPAKTTVAGETALDFNGAVYLDGPASLAPSGLFATIIRMRPKATLATGVIHAGRRSADANGAFSFMFADGGFRGSVIGGQQGTASGMFVANTTVIAEWNFTGAFHVFGKNGAYNNRNGVTTTGPAPAATEAWRVGMGNAGANYLNAYVYDILNFSIPLRNENGVAVDTQLATVLANL